MNQPRVEGEEQVYTYSPANNGAGPLWCYGATCVVRHGDDVFAAGLETIAGAKPLNNCRWTLHHRGADGWRQVAADPVDRQREPCPLTLLRDGRLFLSTNPTLTAPDTHRGPAEPRVLELDTAEPAAWRTSLPRWSAEPRFTEHSYRTFAADGLGGELILFNVLGHEGYHWALRDRDGEWSHAGELIFPWGADYEVPEAIRCCYPEIAMRGRAVHFLGISDIIEPVKAWREYKLVLHEGKTWDYEFRRLFYTWTPDVTREPFAPWLEVASREATCGRISNLDLWLDPTGRAHLLWLEQSVWDPRMRERFFPDTPITFELCHAAVADGKVIGRGTTAQGGEGISPERPGWARLHATPDGRLFVFYHVGGETTAGQPLSENRLAEIRTDGSIGGSVTVPLRHAFTSFMTATERGGSAPSEVLDVLGVAEGVEGIAYARIRVV
ncbi:MAG: hypothetical protein HYU66_03375 [Armatimonadetes bacterium]|nr:hypothetical protein [Armatimonadota bacterium]